MSGKWIKCKQVELFMEARTNGYSQVVSAAKAGISERTARNIEHQKREDPHQASREWRTRKDPFASVWENELIPMLKKTPHLSALTLLEHLQEEYPGEYPDNKLRTLQRRVNQWSALEGPEKEVMFRQEHQPGQFSLSDFTTLKNCEILINGVVLNHIIYHFRLTYSHWSYMKVILGGESYTALAEGLQEALLRLGGSPKEHRTDHLSAAYKNLTKEAHEDVTKRYESFCEHYSLEASRNNLGAKHENGSIESSHGHLKKRIAQALLLRGSNNFNSVSEYQQWLETVVEKHNQRNAKLISIEKASLTPLPRTKAVDYTEVRVRVTSSSTISMRSCLYTVPSTYIGHILSVRLYDDRLECFLGSTLALTLRRVRGVVKRRARNIDYRHIIHSLVKKPQAFRHSQFREDLYPDEQYRRIWEHVDKTMPAKSACKFFVGLLYLAATEKCEDALSAAVLACMEKDSVLTLSQFEDEFRTTQHASLVIDVQQHSIAHYNLLIPGTQEAFYVQ
jgi:transposase InsO family protein